MQKQIILWSMILLTTIGLRGVEIMSMADIQKQAPRSKRTFHSRIGRFTIVAAVGHLLWRFSPEIYATIKAISKSDIKDWTDLRDMSPEKAETISRYRKQVRDQYSKDHPAHKKCPFGLVYRIFSPKQGEQAPLQKPESHNRSNNYPKEAINKQAPQRQESEQQ